MEKTIRPETRKIILKMQQNELNEYHIYKRIAARQKDAHNRDILERIMAEELVHYEIWKKYTQQELKPHKLKIWMTVLSSIIFGFTFTVKRMENQEELAQREYAMLIGEIAESAKIKEDEEKHEMHLLEMLDEERLKYVGSMVLGLNDALVELTGTLAGLSFALQNTQIIALSGLITGISATLSMASSEFLSARSEGRKDAFKSCVYTGFAYLITVALLITPYLIFPSHQFHYALISMLAIVVVIIFVFNYYIAVAKSLPFKKRFLEMAAISLGVAFLSFAVGLIVKHFLGIEI